MLQNYLTTFLRAFLRQPVYSAINVFGLVFGLVCSIFIFLWELDELGYDQYHPDNDRVYKVMSNFTSEGSVETTVWTNGLLAEAIKAEIPEVEQTTRINWSEVKLFKYGETSTYRYGDFADPGIFEVLNIALVEGNIKDALPDINSVAISQKMARAYFKNESAFGRVFLVDNSTELKVTAVFEDLPENTTEGFEFILPFQQYIRTEFPDNKPYDGGGWQYTLVKLNKDNNPAVVNSKIAEVVKKIEAPEDVEPIPPFLHAMKDWRLHSNFVNGQPSGGRISYVVSFGFIGCFILLIACINFMNLSTARSVNRAREVGIRKVAGASRMILVRQFMAESIALAFLSLIAALLLVHLLLPAFNSFTEKRLAIDYLNPAISGVLIAIALLTGIVSGSYPAFFLASFRPASVLKGNLQAAFSGANIRRGLVVFQFGLSMVMIVCAWVVHDQIRYLRNKNLGFDKNNVMAISNNEKLLDNYDVFRNELLQNPQIEGVSLAAAHPMEINGSSDFNWAGKAPDDDSFFNYAAIDYDYLPTLRFTIVAGRNFSRDFPSDSANFVVTESVVKHIGFANPIGERLTSNGHEGQIVGVIRDFNNLSIKEPMHPTVLQLGRSKSDFGRWANVFVRYESGKTTEALAQIRAIYKNHFPEFPIQFNFVDETFEHQFKSDMMVATLSTCFTVVTIVISVLGLFGLASFSAERRHKEIGIRKVLGASVTGLVVMLCRDFTRLTMYGILLGSPLAYYLMKQFLSEYPYHTEIGIDSFGIPAFAMLLISLGIVSYQSIKASISNPVEALRSE